MKITAYGKCEEIYLYVFIYWQWSKTTKL